jgi:hypothetical protein
VIHHDGLGTAHLAGHRRHRRHVFGREREADGCLEGYAVELAHEVEVPVVAPELAVGDRLQADRFLLRHRAADRRVLDRAQVRMLCFARGGELGRPQQAADVVGVKRRGRRHAPILQVSARADR